MYPLSLALPLAIFFPTIALVSAIPQGTQTAVPLSPASQPTNATNGDPRVCIANRRPLPFSMRYIVLSQCLDAISHLPSGDQIATFRDHGEEDDYYLPKVRKAQDCQVKVSLPYSYNEDTFSWNELKIVANYLAEKCCLLRLDDNPLLALEGTGNKGAYVPTGQHGKMRIDLEYISIGSGAEDTANEPTTLSIGGNTTNLTSDTVLGETTGLSIAGNTTNITSDAVLAA